MNLPLPAHQLTLDEIHHYMADHPVCSILFARIAELEEALEKEKAARDADDDETRSELWDLEQKLLACETELARMETVYLALKEGRDSE